MNLDAIFLTGLRPDTIFGLPGLLATLSSLSKDNTELRKVRIYAPAVSRAEKYIEKIISLSPINPPVELISPGDIVIENDKYTISAFKTNGNGFTIGYRVEEAEQKGRFDRQAADELGIPVGPKFGELHEGKSVELDDGRTIEPEQVVGPSRPGRSLVYSGATDYIENIPSSLKNADVAFLDGGTDTEYRTDNHANHMTGYEAGTIAGAANVSSVVLTHVRSRYNQFTDPLAQEITEAYSGPYLIGEDGVKGTIRPKESLDSPRSDLRDVLSKLKGHSSVGV